MVIVLLMEKSDSPAKTPLEASNARLTLAFHHLQDVIEKQLQARAKPLLATEQQELLLQENNRLKGELLHLSQEYASLKHASMDAFTHLNNSINQLESLIVRDEGSVQ